MPLNMRTTDRCFAFYFLVQIPSTLFFDSQGVYPEWIYPSFMKWPRTWYLAHYKDSFLENAWNHPWYLSVCLLEHWLEMPFFFWAVYTYYQAHSNGSWSAHQPRLLLPIFTYGIKTSISILYIWSAALLMDFRQTPSTVSPQGLSERLKLCSAYVIFFVFAVWMVKDAGSQLWKMTSRATNTNTNTNGNNAGKSD